MTAPRAREQADPPSPPDRRPPRRGTGSSPSIYAASAAGRRVPPVARHGLVRSARALAAAALLALTGALFLPPTAEAQTATTLVSNTGQGTDVLDNKRAFSQRFTTGSNEEGYTLTGVDVVSASSTGFTAQVCGVDSDLKPTSTCTDLTAPDPFAVGTMSFTAPTNTVLVKETTYAVVVTALATNIADTANGETWNGVAQGWGVTYTNGEDAGPAAGWSLSDNGHSLGRSGTPGNWSIDGSELRIAIKGSAVEGGTASTDATLSALSLGTGVLDRSDVWILPGTGVVFDQPFASGTYVYTATVGNAENDVQGAGDGERWQRHDRIPGRVRHCALGPGRRGPVGGLEQRHQGEGDGRGRHHDADLHGDRDAGGGRGAHAPVERAGQHPRSGYGNEG